MIFIAYDFFFTLIFYLEDRIKAFTKDMEMAAILCLAESDREKGEDHILKKPDEKLVFIAEACYPIWLVPWSGGTLLFDGLGVTAHTLSYETLPDVKAFKSDIKGSAKTCEAYSAALSRNASYFKDFAGKEEKTIGLRKPQYRLVLDLPALKSK